MALAPGHGAEAKSTLGKRLHLVKVVASFVMVIV